jgi:Zn-dependent protease
MPRQTFVLGRLFEIRVGVHVSWVLAYALLTVAIAHALDTLPRPQALALAASCALALFASVVAHEFAHALVARRFGVRTEAITLFLFGGVATLEEEPRAPRADALIALAGPALSGVLALLAFALLFTIQRVASGATVDALALLTAYLTIANVAIALFNLIPAYPMDGGRVLRAVLWRRNGDRDRATSIAARLGIAFAVLFVAAGVLAAAATRNVLYGWYAVLGAFLLRQGRAQLVDVEVVTAA